MSEDVLRFITKRRSVREFTGEPVERAKLETALKAAMAAPSARNSRPWDFIVVTDRERVRAVCRTHPYAKFGVDAGAVVLPFGKKEGYRWFDQDMGAATENLLVALANLGLGATWCGMTDDRQEAVRTLVGLPDGLYVFALIPVGVPAAEVPARTQYESGRVHWELYQRAA
jgi:nitroreductase